jgi:hypothetical protein
MDLDELIKSKSEYMKKEDVGVDGVDLTILGFKKVKVENKGVTEEKVALIFMENGYKPLLLGITKKDELKQVTGATTTDQCKGKVINVFCDPGIRFGTAVVGGVRIREPVGIKAPTPADEEDVPF